VRSDRTQLFAGLLLAAACAPSEAAEPRALYELERLAFIPPARCSLTEFSSPRNADCSLERAIVFDRFEFTRGDLAYYWAEREPRSAAYEWSEDVALDSPERVDWPAFVDYHEAEELAAERGMRLPTPREWLHVAVGRRDYQVPWGGREGPLWANVLPEAAGQRADFSLRSPWKVGTFENGRSRPFGCYDLMGNVWEWVDGILPGYEPAPYDQSLLGSLDLPDEAEHRGTTTGFSAREASIMGGAYNTPSRWTYRLVNDQLRFHSRKVDKSTLSPSLGARMCADAEPYLWSMSPRWGTGESVRERVGAVGSRWAEDALARDALRALLAELSRRPGAAPALAWLQEGVLAGP